MTVFGTSKFAKHEGHNGTQFVYRNLSSADESVVRFVPASFGVLEK